MFTSVVRRNNDIRSDKVCAKKKKGQKGKKSSKIMQKMMKIKLQID